MTLGKALRVERDDYLLLVCSSDHTLRTYAEMRCAQIDGVNVDTKIAYLVIRLFMTV